MELIQELQSVNFTLYFDFFKFFFQTIELREYPA